MSRRERSDPLWSGSDGDEYDARFHSREVAGLDVHGEARFIVDMGPRSVLDAGCGTGRVAIELDRHGVDVIGVDLDEGMLGTARRKAPHIEWLLADLANVVVCGDGGEMRLFDIVVAAGNVIIFVDAGSEGAVVSNLARHLTAGGALVAGFQLLPGGLDLATYDRLAESAGLRLVERWATWDRRPFSQGGDYAVSVHRRVGAEGRAGRS